MNIGETLRTIRTKKNLSQGEVKKRSGLNNSYISRLENGHTIPSLETLEKLARALEVPLYSMFVEGNGIMPLPEVPGLRGLERLTPGRPNKEDSLITKFCDALSQMNDDSRQLILLTARRMANRKRSRAAHAA